MPFEPLEVSGLELPDDRERRQAGHQAGDELPVIRIAGYELGLERQTAHKPDHVAFALDPEMVDELSEGGSRFARLQSRAALQAHLEAGIGLNPACAERALQR